MDNEVIARGQSIIEKVSTANLRGITLMDVIFVAGVIALVIFAAKVVSRFFKTALILLAVGLLLFWLAESGLLGGLL